MRSSLSIWACLVAAASVHAQDTATPAIIPYEVQTPMLNSRAYQGCFSSKGEMEDVMTAPNVTSGLCSDLCLEQKSSVFGMSGATCYCGSKYPPEDSEVDQKNCNFRCQGYQQDTCGGIKGGTFYDIFNSGIDVAVVNSEPEETTTSAKSTPTTTEDLSTPSSTGAGQTAGASATNAPSEDDNDGGSGGPSIGGIIAGVVVGVVAIAAIAGGIFWWMRKKRNSEIEEEHRRNAAVNSFIAGAKPPGSSGGISMTDSRMDPGFAHRRMSDGSIADNQDYSRKILRVTNA
ncbi:hypothetical protein ACHAQH_005933 [Verticillium albo-atrum]